MGTDFTARLRRALALRHTDEGRALVGAVLVAVAPRDPDAAIVRLGALFASPEIGRAPTLDAWLGAVARAFDLDPERLLAHRGAVAEAFERLACSPGTHGPAARSRARDALRTAVDAR